MPHDHDQLELPEPTENEGKLSPTEPLHLRVTFNLAAGGIDFDWARGDGSEAQIVARGRLLPSEIGFGGYVLDWRLDVDGKPRNRLCGAWPASIRALLDRIRKTLPLAEEV